MCACVRVCVCARARARGGWEQEVRDFARALLLSGTPLDTAALLAQVVVIVCYII